MSNTPLWLQVVIPVGTLFGGFLLGRVSKRLDRRMERKEEEAAKAPSFEIVRTERDNWYMLVNTGDAEATSVTLDLGGFPPKLTRRTPTGITLLPDQPSDRFFISGSWQEPKPAHLTVSCDQLDRPVSVLMPR